MKSSRFIQPKRPSAQARNSSPDDVDDNASTAANNRAKDADGVSPTTVAMVTDVSATSTPEINIEDLLSNLEQVYSDSTSFSKWDDIRKTEEREHALMQGKLPIPTTDSRTKSNDDDDDDNDIVKELKGNHASLHDEIADDDEQNDSDDVQLKCLTLWDEFTSGVPATKEKRLVLSKEVCLFILWTMLCVGWLRISSLLRS